MYYTDEQAEKILANIDMIVEYIKKDIMPLIPEDKYVKAEFENKHGISIEMRVSSCSIRGYISGEAIHFDKDEEKWWARCVYDFPSWAAEFVFNWKEIKERLHRNVDDMNAELKAIADAIYNFEV